MTSRMFSKGLPAVALVALLSPLFTLPAIRSASAQESRTAAELQAETAAELEANKAAAARQEFARTLVGTSSIHACNAKERKGYTAPGAVTLEPTRYLEKELCVAVPASVVITKWACEFAKDRKSTFCNGIGIGSCEAIGWVWPVKPRVYSSGNFNYYCITGHQDSDREWRYFNIHLYNDSMQ
jgi:hypothetical protein